MKVFGVLVALLLVSFLGARDDAYADVILQSPPPDFQLYLDIGPSDFSKMKNLLAGFGRSEGLVPVAEVMPGLKNPPRARGKQFYLFLTTHNSDRSLLAEKAPGRVFHIECYENAAGSGILPMVNRLRDVLQKQWPYTPLKLESRWLQRNPPPPVHLVAPQAPLQPN